MASGLESNAFRMSVLIAVVLACSAAIFLPSRTFTDINGIAPSTTVEYRTLSPFAENTVPWALETLPHDWSHTSSSEKTRWYRIIFDAPTNANTTAVYIPVITHHAVYYLNGEWLAQTGDIEPRLERHHNAPQWLEFSTGRLAAAGNELIIELRANTAQQGLLAPIYVGDAALLRDAYRFKQFIRVDWVQWCSLTMYLIAAVLATFWFNRRKETVYGVFALAMFIWATHNLNLFVNRIPVSHRLWEAMTMATLGWTVVAILFFDFRFLEKPSPKIEKFMLGFCAAGLLFFFMPSTEWILNIGYSVWDACLVFLGSYALVYLMKAYHSDKSFDAWLMMLVGVPILLTGLHDILLVNSFWPRTDGLIIQYSVIPTGLLFGWFLIRRFVQSLNVAEQHADILTQKVQEAQIQLTEQFAHIKDIELKNLLSAERERIMRDMHDGIGGQLLALQSNLNQQTDAWVDPLKAQVKHTLVDFRLVIDSLDPLLNDIPTLLGQMRPRLQTILDANHITLHWDIDELPDGQNLGPETALQLMRIIQEAVTNAVKHANTPWVRIRAFAVDGDVHIAIEDAGTCDTAPQKTLTGRGIDNMKHRADAIGADLQFEQTDTGTRVSLQLCKN